MKSNYYFPMEFDPEWDNIEDRTAEFLKTTFHDQLKYETETEGRAVKVYPKDLLSCSLLLTYEINHTLKTQGDPNFIDYPSPYWPMDTHYFLPQDYGLVQRADAVGTPKFNPSDKFRELVPDRC